MKYGIKKRILSLVLCISMLIPMLTQAMPVYSVAADDINGDTTYYDAIVGAIAEWDVQSTLLASNHFESNGDVYGGVSVSDLPKKLTIVDCAYDDVNAQLWYKVDAAPGYTWPENFANYHWVYDYAVKIVSQNGMTGVFDAEGNAVTKVTMGVYEEPVLKAASSLQGNVKYQWQIEYEDGKWVDIYGEDRAKLTVTIGILASLLNENGTANLRCISKSASKLATSDTITVTVDYSDLGDDNSNPTAPSLNLAMNGVPVTAITMKYGDYNYTAPITAITSGLSGDVSYTWKLIKMDNSEVLLAENAGSEYTLDYSTINSNSQYYNDVMYKVILSVTASNGADSATKTVEIHNLSNSLDDYIQNEDGEYIDVYVAGNLPSDVTLDLTKTESTVNLPSDSAIAATLDITLRDANGNEWQPAEGETVKISINAKPLGLNPGDFFTVYHMHEGKVQLLGPYLVDTNGYATFEVVGFSLFALSTSFEAVIGSTATFLDATAVLNSAYDAFDGAIAYTSDLPAKVVVLAYAFDDVTCKTYVKIDAAPGYTWPSAYTNLHWVESTELATINVNGEAGIYDLSGNPITETTMGVYDEPTYTASSTLQGEVKYQWQICYDTENDLWVDIYGQTDANVKLTVGMLASRLDANNKAYVRCVVSDNMRSAVSSAIVITVSFDDEEQGGEEDSYTADITIDDQVLDSVEVYYGDYGFEAVLGATTNLTGNLTYSWDLYKNGTLVQNLSTESTLEIYYMLFNGNWEYVDSATRKATIVLTVSDGTNTCESTFAVYEITAAPVSLEIASYSLESARSYASPVSAIAAEANEYTVTITYKYENGEQAYEYFTGEVSPGVNLTDTVTFPVIPGYEPWLNGEQVDSLKLNVTGNDVTADILYEVVYKPALVNVTVIIEHQNIYDDGYTPVDTQVIQRLTGSYIDTITEFADKYPGFYQLEHSKPEVAADGSTTVTIKFNRLYYLMRFDLGDGGYGVQPVYARYGTEVEVPDPKSPGYIFLNWKSYDGSTINSTDGMAKFTMPAYDCTVTAIWEATDVNYTIVYWKENADPETDGTYKYSYWTSEVVPSRAGEYVSGGNTVADLVDDERYFTYNDARTDKNVLVKGDSSTVVNVYYTRNSYTIYFYGNGDCAIPEHTHGTGCNSYLICGKETHIHDESCGDKVLSCGIAEHTHSEACCTKEEHTVHTSDCCTATHVHSASCYTITYQYTDWRDQTQTATLTLTTYNGDTDLDNRTPWANGIVRISSGWSNTYYIKLDGTWYELSGNTYYLSDTTTLSGAVSCAKVHDHTDGTCTCGKEIHTHGDGNCSCSMTVHAHIDSCYTYPNCSEDVHTHTDACYSECTLVEHTHGNNCPTKNNGNYNVIRVITAKYEADIYDEWPTADHFEGLASWSGNGTTQSSRVVTMNEDWCDVNDGLIEVTANYNNTKYQLNYWFEDFDQTSTTTSSTRVYNSTYGKYYVLSEKYTQIAYYGNTSGWGHKEITGMTATTTNSAQRETVNGVYTFNLYYNRDRYTLKFQNIDEVIYTENQVMFEKPLNYYLDADGKYVSSIVPSYPDSLEDGAYEFAGWYTTPECFEGTKFDFTTGKMPNGDLTLFAKWAPVKHNVTFYTSKDSATGELKDKIGDTVAVPHGSKINEQYIPQAPDDFDNGQYTFDGWFYMDNGVEKAFSFKDMTVTQELNVYARWISNKQINYIFHFELADGTVIADPVTGSGLAGETITVNAKGDTALYSNYQEGYFPNVKSHSIDLDIEDEDGLMEYTFVYSPVDAVPYTVYYVAETLKDGGTSLGTITRDGKTYYIIADTEVYDQNRKSYVVEQFKAVSGYLPDAYQKSTPIVYGETNEIIFYYTVDSIHAYYKITHYIQNLDGNSWTEHRVIQSQGMIGSVYSADPLDIPGYTYNSAIEGTMTSGTLTAEGLELKLYYVRNKYPYKVVYKVQETGEILYDSTADGVIETDFFDKVISLTAPGTYGIYGLVGDATQTLVIRVEEDPKNPTLNVITFYYTERVVDLNYVIVAPDGTVYRANQTWGKLTSFGESVKVSTGKANGSTSSVESNVYKFVGWYSDPECKTRISDKVTFVPTKEDGTLWGDGTTYYAKFEYNLTSLKIQKQGHDPIDENQTFLFRITDEEGFELTVTVHGNGSVTIDGLTVGKKYKIVEISEWSWRYTNDGVVENATTVTITDTAVANGAEFTLNPTGNVITFTNERSNPYWLDGDSWCNNIFKKGE